MQVQKATPEKLGLPGELVTKISKLGQNIISQGQDFGIAKLHLARTSTTYYEDLWKLDVLDQEDNKDEFKELVYDRFEEQGKRREEHLKTNILNYKSRLKKVLQKFPL